MTLTRITVNESEAKPNSALHSLWETPESIESQRRKAERLAGWVYPFAGLFRLHGREKIYFADPHSMSDWLVQISSPITMASTQISASAVRTEPSTASVQPSPEHRLWEQLEQLYTVANKREVYTFLADNPDLVPVLREAYSVLCRYFGENPRIELRLSVDPEVEGLDMIFADIVTKIPVEQALAQLAVFDESWFLDAMARVHGKLNFNLRFL